MQRQPGLVSAAAYQLMLRELFLHASRIASELLPQLGSASGDAASRTARGATLAASGSSSGTAAGTAQPPTARTIGTAVNLLGVLSNSASPIMQSGLTGVVCDEQSAMGAAAGIGLQHVVWLTQLLEATLRQSGLGDQFPNLGAVCWSLLGENGAFLRCTALEAGPDSPEQARLISLCCSVLKALACSDSLDVVEPYKGCIAVMQCAAALVLAASTQDATALRLPLSTTVAWLAVLGRCFLLIAAAVQQHVLDATAAGVADSAGGSSSSSSSQAGCPPAPAHSSTHDLVILLSVCIDVVTRLQVGTQGCVAAQLSAAGFDAAGLLRCARDCPADELRSLEGFQAALQQVQALGTALASLPLSQACNNASCSNLSGPMELQLVKGRSCRCSGCKQARYCSRACQVHSWKQHKPVCKALQAAASASAAATAAAATSAPAAEDQA